MPDDFIKQGPLARQIQQELRVPLYANQKIPGGVFNGLHNTIQVMAGHHKAITRTVDTLIVQAVDF